MSETQTEKFSHLAQVPQVEALSVVEEIKIRHLVISFLALSSVRQQNIRHQCRCRDQTQPLLFGAYLVICRQGLELKAIDLVASLGQGPRLALPQALSAVWEPLFTWENLTFETG